MKQKINNILILAFINLLIINVIVKADPFHVELTIMNQPDTPILFGWVQGDEFNLIDSAKVDNSTKIVTFIFPANAHPGTYRFIFGKTAYAKVMDESPQQLDIIFNNENIVVKTDFKSPVDSLKISESEENKIWYGFLSNDIVILKDIQNHEEVLNRYLQEGNNEKAIDVAGEYNQLQLERDVFLKETMDQNPGLLASGYIKNQRKPLLDGYLSEVERDEFYKKNFFKNLDFSDERLINSMVYSENVFEYLTHYNQPDFTKKQRENAYIGAVDVILQNVNKNEKVSQFLLTYMVNGFRILQLDNVIVYIKQKYNFRD